MVDTLAKVLFSFSEISRDPWSFRITVKSENSTSSNNSDDGKGCLFDLEHPRGFTRDISL